MISSAFTAMPPPATPRALPRGEPGDEPIPESRAQATAEPAARARGREPAPAQRQAPARATPDDPAATPEQARASAATRRDQAAQERRAEDAAGPRREFAELLADQARPEPTPAATPPAGEAGHAGPAAGAALPERLLALLTGAWPPAAAADAPAQPDTMRGPARLLPAHAIADARLAPTLANPAQPSTGTAVAAGAMAAGAMAAEIAVTADGTAPATPAAAAIELPAATAASVAAAGPGGDAIESFAALAKLAADALGASHEPPAGPVRDGDLTAAPDAYAVTGPAALAGGARATAPAPGAVLNLPASPEAGFDDGFGTRIAWMAEQRMGHAQIRLNPEHVGPIDVRVHLDGDRVSAEFHSAHAEVRQAIEASLPRLRELLGQHGLQLGQTDVGQHQAGSGEPAQATPGNEPGNETDRNAQTQAVASPLRNRGLLDEYA